MPVKFLFISALLLWLTAPAQTCTAPGQNPGTAFPVCGTTSFRQTNVPACGNRNMPVPCNDGASYQDLNPFWYKFTCFSPGALVFTITPVNLNDDYDWQLFDVTGHNPDDIYTDRSLFVCCNWSGRSGITGTNLTATNNTACAGETPIFSRAPALILDHNYLLLISHFTGDSQSGYSLSFNGTTGNNGTASITDTTPPRLQAATADCNGSRIIVKLNKKMKCSSLTAIGSDFAITGTAPAGPVVSAVGAGCSTGFDTDSITLTLQNTLVAGTYQLIAQNGSDNNTLLDNCGNGIPVGNAVPFSFAPGQPTPFDSLSPVGCAPQTLKVVFRKAVQCSSVAADGSDFTVNGATPVTVTAAAGTCNSSGFTSIVNITLNAPIYNAGSYQLVLKRGTDGNTIVDECAKETPAGSTINFTTADTVSADFSYQVFLGCKIDSVVFSHDGRNGVNRWNWLFDGVRRSSSQDTIMRYKTFGTKTARLAVSNGVCADTTTVVYELDNYLKAGFSGPAVLCPKDTAAFADTSLGKIRSWAWNFGNGNTSTAQRPPVQLYPPANLQMTYVVQLLVEDSIGCRDTISQKLIVVNNCYIDVPTAFTPNGDGLNDYLYPLNAYKAEQLQFRVYNRLGQLVWQTTDWTRKWDGRVNGQLPATSTFVWFLEYTHRETKQKIHQQGTTVLIR